VRAGGGLRPRRRRRVGAGAPPTEELTGGAPGRVSLVAREPHLRVVEPLPHEAPELERHRGEPTGRDALLDDEVVGERHPGAVDPHVRGERRAGDAVLDGVADPHVVTRLRPGDDEHAHRVVRRAGPRQPVVDLDVGREVARPVRRRDPGTRRR